MKEKIEYIDKSVLTEEQRNEIEKVVLKKYNEIKKENKQYQIVLNSIVIVAFLFLMIILFGTYQLNSSNIKDILLTFVFGLAGINIMILIPIILMHNTKEYCIIKTKVIEKFKYYFKGSNYYKVKVTDGDKEYKLNIFDSKIYYKIRNTKPGIYVVTGKKLNGVLSGTILLDITNMIE